MADETVYRFGVFEVDARAGEIRKAGRIIRLPPQPFKLLLALLARPGEVVARDELRQLLWSSDTFVDFDQGLNFCVKQIRAAFGDDAETPRYIETIPRRGYRFIAPVQPQAAASDGEAARVESRPQRLPRYAATMAIAVIVAGSGAIWLATERGSRAEVRRAAITFELAPTGKDAFPADMMPVFAPDGRTMVFSSGAAGRHRLYLRGLGDPHPRALPGTDGATWPFWAPNGQRLGFFADNLLKTLDLGSGTITTLCPVADGRGGSWSRGDVLLVGQRGGPLLMLPAGGGRPATVPASASAGGLDASWPQFLPDGRHFLFTVRDMQRERTGIYLGELESAHARRLLSEHSNAVFADGYLFYAREPFKSHVPLFSAWRSVIVDRATLMAQRFDPSRLEPTGDPIAVVEDIRYWATRGLGTFDASASGLLAYRRADDRPHTRLKWFNRAGSALADFGEDTFYPHPEISPDGSQVAFVRVDDASGNADIWLNDLVRNVRTRLTFDPSVDSLPVWSPDGRRIAFASDRQGPSDLYVKNVSGSESESVVGRSAFVMFPTGWSPDGRTILFQHHQAGANSLDAIPVDAPDRRWAFAADGANDAAAQFSPDGRWVAHASGHGDRIPTLGERDLPQLVVQDFPRHSGRWQLTATNGWEPRWRGDGRELYYLAISADGAADVMAAPVDGSRESFRFAQPRKLFTVPVWMGPPTPRNHYDVTRDGQRFLIDVVVERPRPEPLTLVSDWRALLVAR